MKEIVFILDRSGSMSGLEEDTIGGFNSMLKKQKKEEGDDILISTVLFDNRTDIIHDRVPIKDVPELTDKEYYVRGCTALLDALGGTINHISKIHKYARKEDVPENTLFVITTDGMENASRHYSYSQVKAMIEEKKKEGSDWEFIFLGANIDAAEEAGKIGIDDSMAADYVCDEVGTMLNFKAIDKAVSCFKNSIKLEESNWKEIIDDDFKKRGNKNK